MRNVLRIALLFSLVATVTACAHGVRSSYTQAQIASYAHPEMRTMQIGNSTACTHWPEGAQLAIYCNNKLVAELKPKEEKALMLPSAPFTLSIVAIDKGSEVARLHINYDGGDGLLPSRGFGWHDFQQQ